MDCRLEHALVYLAAYLCTEAVLLLAFGLASDVAGNENSCEHGDDRDCLQAGLGWMAARACLNTGQRSIVDEELVHAKVLSEIEDLEVFLGFLPGSCERLLSLLCPNASLPLVLLCFRPSSV